MAFVAISAGIGAVSTGYNIYKSAKKNSAANKIDETTKRPVYNRPKEIGDVYNLSLADANDTGLQDYITDTTGQNEANGIDAVLKSGGKADFESINNSYGSQLKAALAEIKRSRAATMAAVSNAAYNQAQSKDTEFQYNNDASFKDAKQKESQLREEGAKYEADAFNTASATVSNAATALLKPGEYGTNATSFNNLPARAPNADVSTVVEPAQPTQRGAGIPQPGTTTTNSDFLDDGRYIIAYDEYNKPIYSR